MVLLSWLSQQRQATSSTGGFAWYGSDSQQNDLQKQRIQKENGERNRQTKGMYTHTHSHHDVERFSHMISGHNDDQNSPNA